MSGGLQGRPIVVLALLCGVGIAVAIDSEECTIPIQQEMFDAIRELSGGGRCGIKDDGALGPYHITEQYYNEAVTYSPEVETGGMTRGNLWGEGGKEYSEKIIKAYICKHGNMVKRRLKGRRRGGQLYDVEIAQIHKGGSANYTRFGAFGKAVLEKIRNQGTTSLGPDASCHSGVQCKPGQCCVGNQCYCLDSQYTTTAVCQVECRTTGLDVVFLLDESGSINNFEFQQTLNFVVAVSNELTIGPDQSRVAVVKFSSASSVTFPLTQYSNKASLLQGIRNIRQNPGGTNTAEGLDLLRTQDLGYRPPNEKARIAIVVTDGGSGNPVATRQAAQALHDSNRFQAVFAVGVDGAVVAELEAIANVQRNTFFIRSFSTTLFKDIEERISLVICRLPEPIPPGQSSEQIPRGTSRSFEIEPIDGLTLTFDIVQGRILVCVSTTNTNPDCRDPSTYDWLCESANYCEFMVESGMGRRRRQTTGGKLFITVEGVEPTNGFVIEPEIRNTTISTAVLPPTTFVDTVIIHGDPVYEVPLTYMSAAMTPVATSLCYQVHGQANSYYNLISDDCLQVNVLYDALNGSATNYIKQLGILAHNTNGDCTEIVINSRRCAPLINGTRLNGTRLNGTFDQGGVRAHKPTRRQIEITVPSCKASAGDDVVITVDCKALNGQKIIELRVARSNGIKPDAHGLIGQFWNVPIEVVNYTGPYPQFMGSQGSAYRLTVEHPDPTSPPRSFIAELHPATWDAKIQSCFYAGSAQSGSVKEVELPNDHVIEGTYKDYQVSSLFAFDFKYSRFQATTCSA